MHSLSVLLETLIDSGWILKSLDSIKKWRLISGWDFCTVNDQSIFPQEFDQRRSGLLWLHQRFCSKLQRETKVYIEFGPSLHSEFANRRHRLCVVWERYQRNFWTLCCPCQTCPGIRCDRTRRNTPDRHSP